MSKFQELSTDQQLKVLRYAELSFASNADAESSDDEDDSVRQRQEILKELSLSHQEVMRLAAEKIAPEN